MKDKFHPHSILVHPSVSDEEVWRLINSISSRRGGPVILIIEPACELERESRSSHAPWPALGKRAGLTFH